MGTRPKDRAGYAIGDQKEPVMGNIRRQEEKERQAERRMQEVQRRIEARERQAERRMRQVEQRINQRDRQTQQRMRQIDRKIDELEAPNPHGEQ